MENISSLSAYFLSNFRSINYLILKVFHSTTFQITHPKQYILLIWNVHAYLGTFTSNKIFLGESLV